MQGFTGPASRALFKDIMQRIAQDFDKLHPSLVAELLGGVVISLSANSHNPRETLEIFRDALDTWEESNALETIADMFKQLEGAS